MKLCWLLAAPLLLPVLPSQAQAPASALNLDFERVDHQTHLPAGWHTNDSFSSGAATGKAYQVVADSATRHGGRYALRIRSTGQPRPSNEFGVATVVVPVAFQGKTLKLTGFLKTEQVQDGFAGLWLRVDGLAKTLAFDNMQTRPVQGTTGWQQYTTSLPLAAEAETIYLGGLLPASGTLWLDDLALTVDDQPLAQAPPRTVPHYKAEQDTAFRRGSGLAIDNLSKQQAENLTTLGRVWGFVKFW